MTEKKLSEAKSALLKKWLQGQLNDTVTAIPRLNGDDVKPSKDTLFEIVTDLTTSNMRPEN